MFYLFFIVYLLSFPYRALVSHALPHALHLPVEKGVLLLVCKSFDQHDRGDIKPERRCHSTSPRHHSPFRAAPTEERCRNAASRKIRAHSKMPAVTATGTCIASICFCISVHPESRSPKFLSYCAPFLSLFFCTIRCLFTKNSWLDRRQGRL